MVVSTAKPSQPLMATWTPGDHRRGSKSERRSGVSGQQKRHSAMPLTSEVSEAHLHRATAVAPPINSLRDFLQKDDKLNNVVSLFAQKFLQVNGHANFTLNTLTDMAWTVLVLTRDAVIEGKLSLQDGEKHDSRNEEYKARNEELQNQLNKCRMTYLQEVSAIRDIKRERIWTDDMQRAYDELMNRDVFQYVPEDFLDEVTRTYFQAAMEESLKMALTRGSAAAGEELSKALNRIKELETEREEMLERIESLQLGTENLQMQLDNIKARAGKQHADAGKHAASKEALQVKAAEAEAERERMEASLADLRNKLASLGIDPDNIGDATLPDRSKLPDTSQLMKELEAKCADQERQIATLEHKLAAAEEAARLGHEESKKLQERVIASGGTSNKPLQVPAIDAPALQKKYDDMEKSLTKKITDQEKLIADLKRDLKLAGDKESLKKKLDEAETRAKIAENRLKDMEARNAELKAKLEQADADLKTSEDSFRAELDKLRNAEKDARNRIAELSKNARKHEAQEVRDPVAAKPTADSKDGSTSQARILKESVVTESEDGKAAGDEARRLGGKVEKLQTQMAEVAEREAGLREKNRKLLEQLAKAREKEKAMEMMLEDLKKKIQELKAALAERGIDISAFEDTFADIGLADLFNAPVRVFDRLYYDAIKRQQGSRKRKGREGQKGSSQPQSKYKTPFRERHKARLEAKQARMEQLAGGASAGPEDSEDSEIDDEDSAHSLSDDELSEGQGAVTRQRSRSRQPRRLHGGGGAESHNSGGRCPHCGMDIGDLTPLQIHARSSSPTRGGRSDSPTARARPTGWPGAAADDDRSRRSGSPSTHVRTPGFLRRPGGAADGAVLMPAFVAGIGMLKNPNSGMLGSGGSKGGHEQQPMVGPRDWRTIVGSAQGGAVSQRIGVMTVAGNLASNTVFGDAAPSPGVGALPRTGLVPVAPGDGALALVDIGEFATIGSDGGTTVPRQSGMIQGKVQRRDDSQKRNDSQLPGHVDSLHLGPVETRSSVHIVSAKSPRPANSNPISDNRPAPAVRQRRSRSPVVETLDTPWRSNCTPSREGQHVLQSRLRSVSPLQEPTPADRALNLLIDNRRREINEKRHDIGGTAPASSSRSPRPQSQSQESKFAPVDGTALVIAGEGIGCGSDVDHNTHATKALATSKRVLLGVDAPLPPGSSLNGEQITAVFQSTPQASVYIARPHTSPAVVSLSAGANLIDRTTVARSSCVSSAVTVSSVTEEMSNGTGGGSEEQVVATHKTTSSVAAQPSLPLQRRPLSSETSLADADALASQIMHAADRMARNGQLTVAELQAFLGSGTSGGKKYGLFLEWLMENRSRHFKQWDGNHDGVISLSELKGAVAVFVAKDNSKTTATSNSWLPGVRGGASQSGNNQSSEQRFRCLPQINPPMHTPVVGFMPVPAERSAVPARVLVQEIGGRGGEARPMQPSRSMPVLGPQKALKLHTPAHRRPSTPSNIAVLGRKHESLASR